MTGCAWPPALGLALQPVLCAPDVGGDQVPGTLGAFVAQGSGSHTLWS